MKLTDVLRGLGRTVAFHPGLKQITFSTTATLFLCQLIYWYDKTNDKDGWIYKTSMDIEDETGLTKYEQQTARKKLVELGFIEERYKRLDHVIEFRVMMDKVNEEWDKAMGYNRTEPTIVEEHTSASPVTMSAKDYLDSFRDPALHPDHPAHRTDAVKKGDLVDGIAHYAQTPGMRKEAVKNEIRNQIENLLHINTTTPKWDRFIEFVYQRQVHHGEHVSQFIKWAIANGFNPIYWTPDKCKTVYPQAFLENIANIPQEDFVEEPPEIEDEEEYAPMPESLKKKKKLY